MIPAASCPRGPFDALLPLQMSAEVHAVELADRIAALPRRFLASQVALQEVLGALSRGLDDVGREVVFEARVASAAMDKAWEAAAEEAKVRAAQLGVYALLFESGGEGGKEAEARAAHALLAIEDMSPILGGMVCIPWPSELSCAVEETLRVRVGVDAARCVVSGDGITLYHWCGDNVV